MHMNMMKQLATASEMEEILNYLKEDIPNCLYIYLDLIKYGLENPNMKTWIDRDDGAIGFIVMKYHDGFQIYSRGPIQNTSEILTLIEEYQPERVSGNEPVIRQLEDLCANEYESSYGVIFRRTKEQLYRMPTEKRCAFANIGDIPEIVDLLLTEKDFEDGYSREELINQLEDRYRTKMGRSMVIRESGKIVGHMATFAETESIAIVSGAVMHKSYRNSDHFVVLADEFYDQLCRIEQKDAYFFSINKRQIALFSKLFAICAAYGKLIKIK